MSTVTTDKTVNLTQLLTELDADGGTLLHDDAAGTVDVVVPGVGEQRLSDALAAHVAEPEPPTPTLAERLDGVEARVDAAAALAEQANTTAQDVAAAMKPAR